MSDGSSAQRNSAATLEKMAAGFMNTQVLYVAAKLGLADRLSAGPLNSRVLAQAVGADPKALYRLLRAAENLGVVTEPEPGVFALTPLGEGMRSDSPEGVAGQIIFDVEISWPLWGELSRSVVTGQQADRYVYGKGFFDHLQQHPELAAMFNDGMKRFVASITPGIVAAYDFSRFRTVVDIGGGYGTLIAAILKAHPQVHGVIFDLPITIEGTRKRIAELGLGERCSCIGGDFFAEVPAGDAILLSAILSDWDDEQSIHILSNCRRAVSPAGRLLIIERVLSPEEPAPPTAFLDLQMQLIGGMGRTRQEYDHLLKEAGFELAAVLSTGTQRSIFEAVPGKS